jgi:hypothetical protein
MNLKYYRNVKVEKIERKHGSKEERKKGKCYLKRERMEDRMRERYM